MSASNVEVDLQMDALPVELVQTAVRDEQPRCLLPRLINVSLSPQKGAPILCHLSIVLLIHITPMFNMLANIDFMF